MPANPRNVAAFLLVSLLAAAGCSEQPACTAEHNEVASASENNFRILHQEPVDCFVPISELEASSGGRIVDFAASVTSNRDVVVGSVELSFYPFVGPEITQDRRQYYMHHQFDNQDQADITSTYHAGTAGLGQFGAWRWDTARMTAAVSQNLIAWGTVDIPYGIRRPVIIAGPSDVEEYQGFWLAPQVDDWRAVYPLTYQWYQDGAPLGEATQNDSPIYVPGQPGGSTLTFHMVVTDAQGHSYQTLFQDVWVYYAGGCDEPPCLR